MIPTKSKSDAILGNIRGISRKQNPRGGGKILCDKPGMEWFTFCVCVEKDVRNGAISPHDGGNAARIPSAPPTNTLSNISILFYRTLNNSHVPLLLPPKVLSVTIFLKVMSDEN
jgi:hypothetical protein